MTVDLEKFCHDTPLTECNNTVDDGPRLLAPMTLDANDPQAPFVRFVVYLLQTCLYNTSTTNRLSGVGPYGVCMC